MHELILKVMAELRGSWRYRWFAVAVAWMVCVAGWLVVYAVPDSYESRATIYVDTSSALKPLLKSLTVETDVLARVELVTKAMLGRPQLEKVARETDLHLRATSPNSLDNLIDGMRQRISVGTPNPKDPNLYVISYRDIDPAMAQSVVATLLNSFVEDSLGANRLDTQKAQSFLHDQLKSLEAELVSSEKALADFKRNNVGRMPGEGGGYFARLQTEMSALDDTSSKLRSAVRQRDALRQQLSGEAPVLDSKNGNKSDLDTRISDSETRLQELQLRFTDKHPDIIALKETLEQLHAQKQAAMAALTQSGDLGSTSDNPVYQNIQIELSKANVQVATLTEEEQSHTRKVKELRDLINVLPQVEAELARLTRDYDVKQAQYHALLQRLDVAELSESAEQSEDVKFRVIDPPVLPVVPVAPNRLLLLAGVLLAGLAVGGGLAFLGNQVRPVFSDLRSLRKTTGYPVLGSVTAIHTPGRKMRQATEMTAFGMAMLALLGTFLLVVLLQHVGSRFIQSLI